MYLGRLLQGPRREGHPHRQRPAGRRRPRVRRRAHARPGPRGPPRRRLTPIRVATAICGRVRGFVRTTSRTAVPSPVGVKLTSSTRDRISGRPRPRSWREPARVGAPGERGSVSGVEAAGVIGDRDGDLVASESIRRASSAHLDGRRGPRCWASTALAQASETARRQVLDAALGEPPSIATAPLTTRRTRARWSRGAGSRGDRRSGRPRSSHSPPESRPRRARRCRPAASCGRAR